MHIRSFVAPLLIAPALAAPELRARGQVIEEKHVVELTKRQADVNQLLQLASIAGITALPSDPTLLLSLGPLASSLAAQLPTSSVLNVLVTAAPSGFLSKILHDPSYASSFVSDFSKGRSPSWFNSLPTSVKSYLHTYSGFTGLAGAAQAAVTGAASGASAISSGASSAGGSEASKASRTGSSATSRSGGSRAAGATSSSAMTTSGEGSTSASGADTQSTSAAGQGGNAGAGGERSTSSSAGGASKPTGVIAAGVVGAVGVLGIIGL